MVVKIVPDKSELLAISGNCESEIALEFFLLTRHIVLVHVKIKHFLIV